MPQSHIFKSNAATIVRRVKERARHRIGLCMSYERSSKEDAKTGGIDLCLVSLKVETVKARKGSTLQAQKAIEKNDNESWYFTHL